MYDIIAMNCNRKPMILPQVSILRHHAFLAKLLFKPTEIIKSTKKYLVLKESIPV